MDKVKLVDIYGYIFGDQVDRDLNLDAVPEQHKTRAQETKQEALIDKLTQKFGDYIHDESFRNFIYSSNAKLARVLYEAQLTAEPEAHQILDSIQYSNTAIIDEFKLINAKYKLFSSDLTEEEEQTYIKLFKTTKFIGDIIEKNADAEDSQTYMHAYKFLLMWNGCITEIDQFLAQNHNDAECPVHDALVFSMPVIRSQDRIDINGWRSLLRIYGPKVLKYFARADKVEAEIYELGEDKVLRAPKSLEELVSIDARLSYVRFQENINMAHIFSLHNIPEPLFNKALYIEHLKTVVQDFMPDIHISGSEINATYAGYHFVKLPKHDVRGYILGELTNCCQSIGSVEEKCAVSGMIKENSGFYVLLKPLNADAKASEHPFVVSSTDSKKDINYNNFKMVGQGYAWRSIHGNIVIDSWENRATEYDESTIHFLRVFVQKSIEEYGVGRVTIGTRGKTPRALNPETNNPLNEVILEGSAGGDSREQWELGTSPFLEAKSKELGLKHIIYSIKFLEELEINDGLMSEIKRLELNGVCSKKFAILTSDSVIGLYKEHYSITINILNIARILEVDVLIGLVSPYAREFYSSGILTAKNLSNAQTDLVLLRDLFTGSA